jgi:hypothetical protein
MWLSVALVAMTCSGSAFMILFLIALLRERAPSVCYWVIPLAGGKQAKTTQINSEAEFALEIRSLESFRLTTTPEDWRGVRRPVGSERSF